MQESRRIPTLVMPVTRTNQHGAPSALRAFKVCLALNVGLVGCIAHSTASDLRDVRSVVHQRAALRLPERTTPDPEEIDGDVSVLAAAPLTVESAVRIALLNNRTLRAELAELGIARGQLVQASLFPNPEFQAEVRIPEDRTQGVQQDYGVEIDLTQIILRGQRQGVAEAELDAARSRAAGSTLDTAYRVRLAVYDVQAQQQQLELSQTMLVAFTASYDTARALHEAGNLPDLNLSTEQVAYESARINVAEAEADLIDARERLNVLLGFFGRNTTWQLTARLADPPPSLGSLERLESRAIEASIELAQTRATLSAATRRLSLTSTMGALPDINLGVHAQHDGNFWEVGPSLTGSLPVFNRQQGNVISRRAELDSMREQYIGTAINIRAAVRAARARAITAQERARMYRETLMPLRERVVQQTVLQYNAMAVGVFQVLQARREQIDAGRAYIATLHEYWRTRAALEQLLAGRLAGTIATATDARAMSSLTSSSSSPSNPGH